MNRAEINEIFFIFHSKNQYLEIRLTEGTNKNRIIT